MTTDLANENFRINTPWDELDEALDGGLQRGKVYLLRGHGKTTAALNIASAAAAQSVGVALYEWEMYGPEVQRRMAANFNRVPIAEVGAQELEAVWPFPIRIPSDYTDRIEVQEDEGMLVIDYLDYIPSFEDNPHQVLRSLKARAREQNIAVVAVAHLQAPDLYRHVDAVIQIKPIVRPEYPDMPTGEVTISLVKNHTGRPGLSFEAPWFRDQSRIGGSASRRVTDQGGAVA